jgi:uncharacterized protein DUF4185
MPRNIFYVSGSTKKLFQLTGECDRERNQLTQSRTESRFGLMGTDLGSSFEHDGKLYFLFGDSNPLHPDPTLRPIAGDSIAFTRATDPEAGIELTFVTAPNDPKNYLSPLVPGISRGPFEVPLAGFSANGKMYVFFSTDWNGSGTDPVMGRSILAWSGDHSQSAFHYLYDVSVLQRGGKFINLSVSIVNNADIPGLPAAAGQGLLLWGAGLYRKSDPYLAYLPLDGVEQRERIRYFAGIEAGSHRPIWSVNESDAMALFHHPELGEFSVTWNPHLKVWLMLYNAGNPRGINFRVADRPWGAWSPTAILFDPWVDGGYCHFMHVSWDDRSCDAVHDPGQSTVWAGEYGPYVMSRYTRGDNASSTIYFLMSSWNPYNTVVMKSTLRSGGDATRTRFTGNPVLIQSRFGKIGNFEVIASLSTGGIAHIWRNNDQPELPWSVPMAFGTGAGQFDAVSMIQSNFGSPGTLEVIARQQDRLVSFWRDASPPLSWHGPYPVMTEPQQQACARIPVTGIAGNPVLIQSRFGRQGNFEVVVPLASGGLAHYFRDNDGPGTPWRAAPTFGTSVGRIDAVALIQSNFGDPGNLEVVARTGNRLQFFWRDSTSPFHWNGPFPLLADGREVTDATGNPVLIQSKFGKQGNFELVVPLVIGGFALFWRDNDRPDLPWHGPTVVEEASHFAALSLIQSNFGSPGNLEVVSRIGDQLDHSWRDSGPQFSWGGPFDFTSS